METPKSLYSRLALISSVTLVVGYFMVYAAWTSISDVTGGQTLTATLINNILGNLTDLNGRTTTLEGAIAGASVWSKVGSDINYTAGKVGIGTASPLALLEVNSGAILRFMDYGSLQLDKVDLNDTSPAFKIQNTAGTQFLRVQHNGNVGIGTGSPTSKLSIDSSTANIASFNSTSAGGGYTAYNKSGVTYGFIGNADELTSAGGVGLALRSSGNMQIATGGSTTRMTIDSIGNVGIGFTGFTSTLALYRNGSTPSLQLYSDRGTTSSSPAQLMQNSILFGGVNNQGWSTPVGAGIDFSTNYPTDGTTSKLSFWTYPNTSASPAMTVYNSYLGIGTTTPGQKLDIVAGYGRVQTGYSWLTNSDIRYKKDVKTIDNSLNKILHLRGVYYKVKNGNKSENIGVIAQELEKEFPELVVTEANGYKSVKYSEIVAPLINAIKELKSQKDSEIEQLQKRIELLENR